MPNEFANCLFFENNLGFENLFISLFSVKHYLRIITNAATAVMAMINQR